MTMIGDWLDDPNEYTCPYCGGKATVRGYGGAGLGVRCTKSGCEGYLPGCRLVQKLIDLEGGATSISFRPPDSDWVDGMSEEIVFCCPSCGSLDISRIHHDDGHGYVDVKVRCNSCDESTWH